MIASGMLLSIGCKTTLNVVHIDVNTSFLLIDLVDEIYIEQLEGCVILCKEHCVCKLKKNLYGVNHNP